jgi:hypothetical protein
VSSRVPLVPPVSSCTQFQRASCPLVSFRVLLFRSHGVDLVLGSSIEKIDQQGVPAAAGSVDPEVLDEVASESEAIHDVSLAARKVAAQVS